MLDLFILFLKFGDLDNFLKCVFLLWVGVYDLLKIFRFVF